MRHVDGLQPTNLRAPLATTPSLASLHARRADLYEVVAALLDPTSPATDAHHVREALAGKSSVDGEYRCVDVLRATVAAVPWDIIVGEYEELTSDDRGRARAPACSRQTCGHSAEEALMTARLARGTADALWRNDLADASVLLDVQVELLSGHTGDCLTDLASHLTDTDVPLYTRVGEALLTLVEDDRALLALPRGSTDNRV